MYSSCNSSPDASITHSDCAGTRDKWKFPPPPVRLSKSVVSSQSDSSNCLKISCKRARNKRSTLPPLGFFWDIENCQVPKNRSGAAVVNRLRESFLDDYREAEFIVVCDVKKERPQVIQELHDSQVNLIHVASISKNAADEKLRQSLRRFAEVHKTPSCVVLMSSDINFAADLSDLRYRKKIHVILVHNSSASDALLFCANKRYNYEAITEGLPFERIKPPIFSEFAYVLVTNLPAVNPSQIRNRLNYIVDNCGGKVLEIMPEKGMAYLRFLNQDYADRAKIRIQGEDVYGNKIKVLTPTLRNFTGRKAKSVDNQFQSGNTNSRNFACDWRTPQYDLRGVQSNSLMGRRPRTPQDSYNSALLGLSPASSLGNRGGSSEFSDDDTSTKLINQQQPVNLIISNLDPTICVKELRKSLANMLKEYVMILSLNIIIQTDGTPIASIKVNSSQEAQFAISQLHRQKLGNRRIVISYAQNNLADPEQLKAMVIALLQEVPERKMPLFKFIELLESRYHCTVSVSEVNKLKDICKITDDLGARIIQLLNDIKQLPQENYGVKTTILLPYCTLHCPNGLQQQRGWCELNTIQTPNIMMSLKLFSNKLNGLLNLHFGSMPLLSFQSCYEQEYHEPLQVEFNGVPLEHFISCVPNVEIKTTGPTKNIKIIKQEIKNSEFDEETVLKAVAPSLAPNINLLCRELVDLLKTTDKCQLLLSKFIPAYHHHFGRQCHVADYGYTKLIDLFESISHVVQIMGDGTRRVITLTHQAQMRRFTSDLLRVLKVQPNKQITLKEFPVGYEKVMNKQFNPIEYGLCYFEDLLEEIPENTIVINNNDSNNFIISVPKREQTSDEIIRTKQFAMEVIDMLRHSPYCTMLFNKFVPAYHHHFGHQCKVSNYGFSKLIELFEAIPDIVKIQELPDGERTISLTLSESLKIVGQQIINLINNSTNNSILYENLPKIYIREYGYPLKPEMYECDSIPELIDKLHDYVQVIQHNNDLMLINIDNDLLPTIIKIRVWSILINPPYCKDLITFKYEYEQRFNINFQLDNLQQLRNVVSLSYLNDMNYISLTDLYILASELYYILYINNGSVLYNDLDRLYYQNFGKTLKLTDYHINNIEDLYEKLPFLFFQCGYNRKNVLTLNRNLQEHQIPLPVSQSIKKRDITQWPPSPLHKVVQTNMKKVSPPKPDTPPTPGASAPWSHWTTSYGNNLNLSIPMPILQNPQLMGDPDMLISPAKYLLSNRNPWKHSGSSKIDSPHPNELPMPDKLIKGGISDDSTDSGVNSKLDNSPSDNDDSNSLLLRKFGGKSRFTDYF